MALVTISGFPCSGKSTLAQKLAGDFERRLAEPDYAGQKLQVVIVSDDTSHVPRSVYDDSIAEKNGRANLFTNVTRNLGPGTIVICDSLNYIKGFRYQMYCAAREAHARIATIHLATPPDTCRAWHEKRGESSYKPATFDNLFMRYEEPSSMVRWDSPLFTLLPEDEPPFEAIWNTITLGHKAPPTAAVIRSAAPPANSIQVMSATTSAINSALLAHVSSMPDAGSFPISSPPAAAGSGLTLRLPTRRVTLSELQRMKRQFEAVQVKAHSSNGRAAGNWGEAEVANAYVNFLQEAWDTA